jgi:sigma-B regulation protein RsbU (phosphoserine phosphatase)
MARTPRMLVVEPSGSRREVLISSLPFRIGRQTGNELTLRDSRISRQQAQVLNDNGSMVLEDMGSRHGTFVNGQKITRRELHPKDVIDFGTSDSYRLIYVGEEATLEELMERVETPAPSETGSRELHHLGVLLEVARTLGTGGLSLEDVLTSVVDAAIQLTRTERGVLLLADANAKGELRMSVARSAQRTSIPPEQVQVSQSVLRRVVHTRREMIVSDTGDDAGIQQQASVVRLELHTVVAIPLEKLNVIGSLDVTITPREAELLGVLYLDSHTPSSAFSDLDREVLRTLAMEAGNVIENARLFASARAKQRLDHELEIASEIQQRLLPKSFPDTPQLSVAGSTLACLSVGGDCFDVVELPGGRYGFLVGDVSGKGISAALLSTMLQGVFFTTAALDIPLTEIVSRVNQYLCERSGDERYATLFYGVLDSKGQLEYINAGHVPPIIRRNDGKLVPLGSGNLPVGMFAEAEYTCGRETLGPGDCMVIYSDGISEAYNVNGDMLGESGLCSFVAQSAAETAGDLAAAVQAGVRAFAEGAPQADDITLLVVKYKGQGA